MGWTVYNSDGQILQGSSTLADNAVTFAKLATSAITGAPDLGEAPATGDSLLVSDLSASAALKEITVANLFAAPAITGNATAVTQSASNNSTRIATTAYVDAQVATEDTIAEMGDVTLSSIGSGEVLKWNGSAWVNNTLAEANLLPVAGPTFTGVLTVGSAVISEADLEQIDDLTAGTAVASKALVVDSNKDIGVIRNLTIDGTFSDGNYTFDTSGNVTGLGTIGSGAITSSGVVTGTGFTIGSAVIVESELEMIDGITAGTAAASKAVVLDSSTNITGIGTIGSGAITSTGEVTGTTIEATAATAAGDNAAMGYTSGEGLVLTGQGSSYDVSIKNDMGWGVMLIPTGTTTATFKGILHTDVTTNATDTLNGSIQTSGGLSVVKDVVIGDDLMLLSDAAVLNFGVNSDVNLTHVHNTGLLLNSTRQLQFGDAGTYIHQSADGVLDLVSDTEIEINATTIDINGAVDLSGVLTVTGNILPGANNTHDLGSSSYQWQNIYTQDFHLNNTLRDVGNSIDGTKGNWTIQEGDENLFIVNNKTGKKYKFHLTEVA